MHTTQVRKEILCGLRTSFRNLGYDEQVKVLSQLARRSQHDGVIGENSLLVLRTLLMIYEYSSMQVSVTHQNLTLEDTNNKALSPKTNLSAIFTALCNWLPRSLNFRFAVLRLQCLDTILRRMVGSSALIWRLD